MRILKITYALDRVYFDTVKNYQIYRVYDEQFDHFVDYRKEAENYAKKHKCEAIVWSSGEVIPFGKGENKTMIEKILIKFGIGG